MNSFIQRLPADTVTVSRLNAFIDKLLHSNSLLRGLHIKGELSNVKLSPTGHLYFTIGETSSGELIASMPCILFSDNLSNLERMPENGDNVLITASMGMYAKAGRCQLIVTNLIQIGTGDGRLSFEALKRKLTAEGLFNPERKRALPTFPERVGIVTSPVGAAIADIVRTCRMRMPNADLLLAPVSVQGDSAPESIANAIRFLNEYKKTEVIIVGRGGGSAEDLAAFNTEAVARAVANSDIPIISAVGHETDFSLCDFAADARAATPTAAAVLAFPVTYAEIEELLKNMEVRLLKAAGSCLEGYEQRLNALSERLSPASLLRLTVPQEARLDYLEKRLHSALGGIKVRAEARLTGIEAQLDTRSAALNAAITKNCNNAELRFMAIAARLEAASPLAPLTRGYGYVTKEGGTVIGGVNDLTIDDDIRVVLRDGSFTARVNTIDFTK